LKKITREGYDIDSLRQVYSAKNTDNLLIHLAIKSVHLYFIPNITIICSCEWVIVVYRQNDPFSAISWREQVTFGW